MKKPFELFCNNFIKSGVRTGVKHIIILEDEKNIKIYKNQKSLYILKKPVYEIERKVFERIISEISENTVQGTSVLFMYGTEKIINHFECDVKACYNDIYIMQLLEKYNFLIYDEKSESESIKFVNAVYYR